MDLTGKIVVGISFVLLAAWMWWMNHSYAASRAASGSNGPLPPAPLAIAQSEAPAVPLAASTQRMAPSVSEEQMILENPEFRFAVTSHGGGVKEIALKGYPEGIPCGPNKRFISTNFFALNRNGFAPAFALDKGLDEDGAYGLTRTTTGIRAEKVTTSGLRIIKDFTLGSNHQFEVTARIENITKEAVALPVQSWEIGTATPMNSHDVADMMGVMWFDGSKSRDTIGWVSVPGFLCVPTKPLLEMDAKANGRAVWGAIHNQFFAMVTVPDSMATNVTAQSIRLPLPSADQIAKDPQAVRQPTGVRTQMHFASTNLAPGQVVQRKFQVYAGPKRYVTLQRLEPKLDEVMGFSSIFPGATFFAKLLLLCLNGLNKLGLGYGWCIVVLTALIKAIFWPLTAMSTRSAKRMAEVQPQLNALKEKYKDNPTKQQQKMMEFMREKKINPAVGCLPMLIQIPVFFGLFTMLRSAIELRGSSFLWMCDLSSPDTLFVIPYLQLPFNLMPVFYIITIMWQSHLTPLSPQMDPAQQKMMRYMPLMFVMVIYNYSCGLSLYWTLQNLLTILQTKLTKSVSNPMVTPAPVKRR